MNIGNRAHTEAHMGLQNRVGIPELTETILSGFSVDTPYEKVLVRGSTWKNTEICQGITVDVTHRMTKYLSFSITIRGE